MSQKVGDKHEDKKSSPSKLCGLIMPISASEGLPASHWLDVKGIITDVAKDAGFNARLVSESKSARLIHKSIVENVYSDDIVICDVSCKNPNVMFELGMRLAFGKPVVIIKDDKTDYLFDTGGIDHVNYRRDLRYHSVEDFKLELKSKLEHTYKDFEDKGSSEFIDTFGSITTVKFSSTEVSPNQFVMQQLREINDKINSSYIPIDRIDYNLGEVTFRTPTHSFLMETKHVKKILSEIIEAKQIKNNEKGLALLIKEFKTAYDILIDEKHDRLDRLASIILSENQ